MEVDDSTGGRNIDGAHGDPLPNRPRKRLAASKFAEPRRPRKVQVVRPGSDHAGEPTRADSPAQMQIIPVQPRKRNSNVPRSQGGRSGGRRGSSDA
jgi:hypothetical protein